MRSLLPVALTLAAAPAFAQSHSPFLGASPDTLILSGGWEMTPAGTACTLIHLAANGHPDLAIRGGQGQGQLQLGLVLPESVLYSSPVQLTVMAQAGTAEQIGRVTFRPAQGRMGTLLTADWPADRLLPRLAEAARINFYTPDQRLLRSVRLGDSTVAVESLGRCMGLAAGPTSPTPPRPAPPAAPEPAPAAGGGWVPLVDRGGCSIVRQTERGNELSLLFNRRGNLMLVLQIRGGLVRLHNRLATVSATPWRTAGDRAVPVETAASTLVAVHAGTSHEPLVFGRLDPAFLGKLHDPRWNTIALSLYDDAGVSLADRTDTSGLQVAVAALERCEQSLPD